MKKAFFLIITLFLAFTNNLKAQTGGNDFMRNIGMIYVVIGVIIIIFIGIIAFLINLDRKLTKLENQIKENE
jgi:tetrahydromethanopterin S-methyltransferase subunit G